MLKDYHCWQCAPGTKVIQDCAALCRASTERETISEDGLGSMYALQ
jgi:hypothetical protein